MDAQRPLISIVVLNYNGTGFLENCLESVFRSDYSNFEVILVDNNSTDESIKSAVRKFGMDARLRIIRNSSNLLYAGGNNVGIRQARGEYAVVLNNDTEVEQNWLKEIALVMQQDDTIGAAQPKILRFGYFPPRIDYIGGNLDRYGYAEGRSRGEVDSERFDKAEEIFYAGGAAMVLRKRLLDDVGLFDEKFGAHWEDTDLSWRIRLRGYKVMVVPKAVVYHKGSLTMSRFVKRHDVAWCIRKNRIAGLIQNYSGKNLIICLPVLLISYIVLFFKEAIFDKNIKIALSSVSAIIWNIKKLPDILKQRRFVQNRIRCVSDKNIVSLMNKGFIALHFLKG